MSIGCLFIVVLVALLMIWLGYELLWGNGFDYPRDRR